MTDYTKLVKALLSASTVSTAWEKLMRDAADAIEALQAEVERLKDSNEELREKQTFIDHYGTEWITSAKDVPTAAYKHGYADGMAEVKAQLPKRGEWIKDEEKSRKHVEAIYTCSACHNFDAWGVTELYPYCPNCGAKMEEANAYSAEMKDRQEAAWKWRNEAIAEEDELKLARAEGAFTAFTEAKLTMDKHMVNQWVSVEERLPEPQEYVLCCGKKGGCFVGWTLDNADVVKANGHGRAFVHGGNARTFTHWMPIEPPKEGNDA